MANKETDNGFEQMMDIWKQGQSAFLKAQQEVMEGFQKSLSGVSDGSGSEAADAFAS